MGIKDLFEPFHLLVILVIVMLFFGAGKLPQIGKSMGEAIKGFRESSGTGSDSAAKTAVQTEETAQTTVSDQEIADFKKWQALKAKAGKD